MINKKVFCILDCETAGGLDNPLMYDIGWIICDKKGSIYQRKNYLVTEIWDDFTLMNTAYYKDKIPMYLDKIRKGDVEVKDFAYIMKDFKQDLITYGVNVFSAYNVNFDLLALKNTTLHIFPQFQTWKYTKRGDFLQTAILRRPMDILCIHQTAKNTIGKQVMYKEWAHANGFLTKHKTPQPQTKAETMYRFITKDVDFIEEHTALADCYIEMDILLHCYRQKKVVEYYSKKEVV
jgi:hypothetical protein